MSDAGCAQRVRYATLQSMANGSEQTPQVIVNEKTAFGWPVAVVGAACLLAIGGGIARVEGISRDQELLRTRVDQLEYQQNADRGRLHEQGATLTEVKAILVDLRGDIREALRNNVHPASYSK